VVVYNWPSIAFFAVLYAATIAAIIVTIVDKALPIANKVIWVAVIVIVPVFGVVVWAIVRLFRRFTHTPSTP
jgi:Phospholipase_D-nuclease N-terminal